MCIKLYVRHKTQKHMVALGHWAKPEAKPQSLCNRHQHQCVCQMVSPKGFKEQPKKIKK